MSNPLPREIAPGLFWLGQCLAVPFQGRLLHGYNSVYLVCGSEHSLLVETGLTSDLDVVEHQLDLVLARGVPKIRYLFLTHTEIPHAGNVGRLLERFPDAIACGDITDLHFAFPEYAERLMPMDPGDRLDLGGTEFCAVEAVFRDLVHSRWGFDTRSRVLFAGDGFSYSHYHEDGHCGKFAEDAPSLPVAEQVALFAMAAFYWTQFVDVEPYIRHLRQLIFEDLGATFIAPTHGLPISDPSATLPAIEEGLRRGSSIQSSETLIEGLETAATPRP